MTIATLLLTVACSSTNPPAPIAEYEKETGRLRRLTIDMSRNGRHDTVSFMDGTRIDRIELDVDEDGRVDRWDFYRDGATLDRVGFSSQRDGTMDSQAFYGADRRLTRIEISSKRDGRFDRVEFYRDGVLERSEADTDRDGRADRWETYRPNIGGGPGEPAYALTSVAFDDDGLGFPQRQVIYEDGGRSARVIVRRNQ